jgi:enterochelin esterase-like enzyme
MRSDLSTGSHVSISKTRIYTLIAANMVIGTTSLPTAAAGDVSVPYPCNLRNSNVYAQPLPRITLALALTLVTLSEVGAQTRATRDPQPAAKYALGPDSLPQKDVPKGKLEGPTLFKSQVIKDTVRKYWVHVPAQYTGEKPACVLVFHDGARAINPNGVLRVPQVLDNLIAKKQIPVTIGIFITPGQRGDAFPDSIGTGNPNNRDREYDVLADAYAKMVIDEILPEVEKKYKLAKEPENRAIGGSSSGGICAFTVAWERPNEFRNVISLIGSFTDIHGGHVYPDLVKKAEKKPLRVFLQDGELDNRSPQNVNRDWYLQNQKMIAAFKEKGYDYAAVVGKGGHSDDHGGAILPYILRWVWRDHPDVMKSADDLVRAAEAVTPEAVKLFPGYDATAKVDPSGNYSWESRFGNTTTAFTLTVEMKEGKLTGTLETKRAEMSATIAPIADVVLNGNKLMFAVTTRNLGRDGTATYQGIVAKSGIGGWTLTDFNGQPRDSAWNAKRNR